MVFHCGGFRDLAYFTGIDSEAHRILSDRTIFPVSEDAEGMDCGSSDPFYPLSHHRCDVDRLTSRYGEDHSVSAMGILHREQTAHQER